MDGRPHSINKAVFSNFSSVVWTLPQTKCNDIFTLLVKLNRLLSLTEGIASSHQRFIQVKCVTS